MALGESAIGGCKLAKRLGKRGLDGCCVALVAEMADVVFVTDGYAIDHIEDVLEDVRHNAVGVAVCRGVPEGSASFGFHAFFAEEASVLYGFAFHTKFSALDDTVEGLQAGSLAVFLPDVVVADLFHRHDFHA